jgi:hypothetical protein
VFMVGSLLPISLVFGVVFMVGSLLPISKRWAIATPP